MAIKEAKSAVRVFIWSECIAIDGVPGPVSFSVAADDPVCEGLDWLKASEQEVIETAHKFSDDCWTRRAVEYHGKNLSVELVELRPDRPAQSLRFIQLVN